MSDGTKRIIIRVFIHAAMLAVIYVLQSMVFSRLRIFGIAPLILPLAVIGVGLFEGPTWGGAVGLAAGVISDTALFGAPVLFTILLTGIGMGVGLASSYLLSRGFPSFLFCSVIALFGIAFFQMFGLLVYLGESPLALFRVAVLQTTYSLFFLLPIYYLTRYLGRRAAR